MPKKLSSTSVAEVLGSATADFRKQPPSTFDVALAPASGTKSFANCYCYGPAYPPCG